ncbi:glutamyl-tRNA reductase [Flexivirga endophytica]|uniref:Glutamyl-tRNA reductase n=1 Tax=Flexivirga endophytica TaxID=1849103 RepID=A0A916WY01_9MICO|nr:glutamyl-tRNA reductase [Flexivirga endophytica]GGB42617.1 glutamyl-tRNA reductase [Flexivirga endophytica]GHB64154.1 glutamyl-tRNA reductase [Flexivirga endophytica]
MSLIVIGMSHRTTGVDLLERVVLTDEQTRALESSLALNEHVNATVVVSTCNRVEIYADVETFHGAVTGITESLAATTGLAVGQLRDHLYVHFEDRAVAHSFQVAAGLDSVAVGEGQILGQLRDALRTAQKGGHLDPSLSALMQHALRVGKRVHSETDIDTVSRSLVERSLVVAQSTLGELSQQRALVVGAGAMSGLAAHTLARAGIGHLTIINRTPAKAARLAQATGGVASDWSDLTDAVVEADLVISCTGAVGHVLDADNVRGSETAKLLVDLALPRDVDPVLSTLPGIAVISLEGLSTAVADDAEKTQLTAAHELVSAEVAEFLVARRAAAVAPAVAELRARAAEVVSTELARLDQRTELSEHDQSQVQMTVHRVVEKILHTPTVRIKQLAGEEQGGQDYAALLRMLFDLDPHESRVSEIPHGEPAGGELT